MKGKQLLLGALLIAFGSFAFAGKNPNVVQSNSNLGSQQNYKGPAPAWIDAEPGSLYSSTYKKVSPGMQGAKAPFDIDIQIPLANLLNAASLTGIAWTGTEFWVSRWNQDTLFTFDLAGNTSRFVVPGVTGTRSLTFDGTSIYAGGATGAIRQINPVTKTLTSTITLGGAPVGARMCAYDPNADSGNGGFWIANFTSAIQLYSMTGTLLTTISAATHGYGGIYGGAVDTVSAGGPYLCVYAQGLAGGENIVHWLNLNTNTPTGLSLDVNLNLIPNTGIAGGCFIAPGIIPGESHLLTVSQMATNYLTAYEIALPPPPSAPQNDLICDAIEFPWGGGPIIGTNVGATVSAGEPSSAIWDTPADATVWYYFIAPADTTYLVTTNIIGGVNDDTQIAAYTASSAGCTGTLTELMANEDVDFAGGNYLSEDTVQALVGDTIWIQVDGWSATEGTFWLDVVYNTPFTPPPPGNISRDFEAYNGGDWIGVVDDEWSTWGGTTGPGVDDAQVSTAQSQSGVNSLILENANTDALYLMGNKTSGTWGAGFSMYVATGSSAYYNMQEDETPAVRWVFETNFDNGGVGDIRFGTAVTANFTYPQNTWFDVRHYVDLDNDSIQVWIDGNLVAATAYTTSGGTTQLGSFDFFPAGGNGPSITHYIDDMYFAPDSLRSPVSLTAFDLSSPSDGTAIDVSSTSSAQVAITWTASSASSGSVTYRWLADGVGGDFSNPILAFDSDNSGADTQLTLTSSAIDAALANIGLGIGQVANLIWTVEATGGTTSLLADNGPFAIDITRIAGLSDDVFNSKVNFYPNPTSGELVVDVKDNLVKSVVISNMVGQTQRVFENIESRNVLDLSDLRSGLYFVKFVTDKGEITKKLMVD